MSDKQLSLGVAARLSRYLQILTQTRKTGRNTISSKVLSEHSNINPTQIRRDLSAFGKFGKRGVGYDVDHLISRIKQILHTSGQHNIALVGCGNLGIAIASSDVFIDHGFRIAAVFDVDPAKVGQKVGGVLIQHISDIGATVNEKNVIIGVLAVPSKGAQGAAQGLIDAGVKIIFNYSEALLEVPPGVTVHSMSPAGELLYALYFFLS